jgi:hypothetical protein
MTKDDEIPATDKHLRQAVYIAFGETCFYTGRHVPFDEMHVDHVRPRDKGGRDCISNYVLSCQDINLRKGKRHSDRFEHVVLEVVTLLFADKVLRVLDDLKLNRGEFVRANDWMREQGIKENSLLWNRIRVAAARNAVPCIKRVLPGKSRGLVLYRPEDLYQLMTAANRATSTSVEGACCL